ncbi:MAG TPA: MFS transporter, partial [Blastocatellia bacterium]|nr:MFS transporter [Blastocatellia bacterium]
MAREVINAIVCGVAVAALLAALIVVGSRNLIHFDTKLIAYASATLVSVFGITYRYTMWLQRPPTALYWRRCWQVFLRPRSLARNLARGAARMTSEIAFNRFIFRRHHTRGLTHLLLMWGCLSAFAITFPLVFGWIHFETLPEDLDWYRTYVFGFPTFAFPIHSLFGFLVFHGLVGSSILVIAGVMLAMRRRMRRHGAAALQQFAKDFLPLI